jgi:RNA polymerase sigma-54 factor
MAPGLQLSQRLTQSLVLAPQLQQSLALLQAPTLELKALVEQELQQNPVLEEAAVTETDLQERLTGDGEAPAEVADPAEPPADLQFDPATEKSEPQEPRQDEFQAEFDKLVQLDQEWRDHFSQTNAPIRASAEDEERRQFMFDSIVAATSLQEMLLEQVRESQLKEEQWPIAEMLIGNIDDYGYLKATLEELSAASGLPADKIAEVLSVIQTFDPPGVGARDLRECLMLQLERSRQENTLEYRIVRDYMEALGKRRIPEISRGPGALFCRTTINTCSRKCSCKGRGMISSSRTTTSTSRICASAIPTRT